MEGKEKTELRLTEKVTTSKKKGKCRKTNGAEGEGAPDGGDKRISRRVEGEARYRQNRFSLKKQKRTMARYSSNQIKITTTPPEEKR